MKRRILSLIVIVATLLSFSPTEVFAEDICNHNWSQWEVDEEPTCDKPGTQERYCFDCGFYEYAEIPVTNQHEWDDWYTIKLATVSKTGTKERYCSICGKIQTKTTPKLKPYIKLSKKNLKIKSSKTYVLKIKYAKGDSVKNYSSSNRNVATVSKKGNIKAVNNGTAKITVTLKSGKKASCTVNVSIKKKTPTTNRRTSSTSSATVYWVPNGEVYHRTSSCPTLSRSRTIYHGSKSNCPKPRPCKVCY